MRDAAEVLRQIVPNVELLSRNTKIVKALRSTGPARTNEFKRIWNLPRRRWRDYKDLQEITDATTALLKTPHGTMKLKPIQAIASLECREQQGLFGPMPVGSGKTFVSILSPSVVEADRPVLMVPAQLREQTNAHVLPLMRQHWKLHKNLTVLGYSELSIAKNRDILQRLRPDMIVLDEAQSVARKESTRTKRLVEYLQEFPATRMVALSGTMSKRSLRDYWKLLIWTLGPENSPLPVSWMELQDWADAIDEGVPDEQRCPPGALTLFCSGNENFRQAYGRRLTETPGVVAGTAEDLGTSLEITARQFHVPLKVSNVIHNMRETWETPNGDPMTEAIQLWRHVRELALGFWYRWDPLPPFEWMEARRNWKKFVRDALSRRWCNADSELLVWNACARLPKEQIPREWVEWTAIESTFEINTVPEWVDDFAIDEATKWLRSVEDEDGKNAGICWVEHAAFGERLAQKSGFSFYAGGMKASAEILTATGPIIASIPAHFEGKNLQHYSKNLVVAPPSSGKRWEQLLGRTHRLGQKADCVTVDVWLHVDELVEGFRKAISDSHYLEDTLGSQQKLCYANIIFGGKK